MSEEIHDLLINFVSQRYTQKDKKKIIDYIVDLQQKVEQLENIRKEAIDLLKEAGCYDEETKQFCDDVWGELPDLLNILNKGSESNELQEDS